MNDEDRKRTSWLEVLKALDADPTQEVEVASGASSSSEVEFSESLNQEGAKSAKRVPDWLLALLAPRHSRNSENHLSREKGPADANPTEERPWLAALKRLEEETKKEDKADTNTVLSSVDEISEPLLQWGAKSAKSSPLVLEEEKNSRVDNAEFSPKGVQYTLITTQEQLADVVADLEYVDLLALDLETTGLNPRKDRVRLISISTAAGTWLVDCFAVDPKPLFPVLAEKRLVFHNALFDLGFLYEMGFELGDGGEVIDTMLMSQVLKEKCS